MVEPERQRSIVARPRITLDKDQRTQYTEAIMPFVLAAREAFQLVLEVREQVKFLDGEQRRIERQIEESRIPINGRHPLTAALTGIKISRAELQSSPALPPAKEEFRLKANELIAEVNNWKARFAVSSNLVNPAATALIGRPQIPPFERKNKFTRPNSPTRPHNSLGMLSIYRDKRIKPNLEFAIRVQSRFFAHADSNTVTNSLAVALLVPEHLTRMDKSTPYELREPKTLAKHIVSLTILLGEYEAGILARPSIEQIGLRSNEQDDFILTDLRVLFAECIRIELENPNRTEKQNQDLYQDFSNAVRRIAKDITPRFGHISNSYERLGSIIERLPDFEGALLVARLSTRLYTDLGLPCIDSVEGIRLAEVMRNIASSGHWSPGNRADMTVAGYRVPEIYRAHLDKVIESISGRLDTDEIDCQKIFEAIENLDYGNQVIEHLFEIADDDQQGVLLRALMDSNCFTDVIRDIRRKRHTRGYDLDE